MTYTRDGDKITVEMTRNDYDTLLIILGYAAGSAFHYHDFIRWKIIDFVNELNRTNPHFQPYAVPEEEEL